MTNEELKTAINKELTSNKRGARANLEKNFPEYVPRVISATKFIPENDIMPFLQRVWHLVNGDTTSHQCKGNNRNRFISFSAGYQKHCPDRGCLCYADTKAKRKATTFERFGVENIMHCDEGKQRVKNAHFEKYGVENVFQSEFIKDKIKATNLKNYGFEYASQSVVVKDKMKSTNLERYGVEQSFQSEVIKDKIKNTNLERYGVEYSAQSNLIKDKMKATNLVRFGCEYAIGSNVVRDKIKSNTLKKYGVEFTTQIHIKELINLIETLDFWKQFNTYDDIVNYLYDKVSKKTIHNWTHKYRPDLVIETFISYPHKIINNFLTELNIEFKINTKQVITPLELDIYIPGYNLAIEVNGIYWHSESRGKDKNYHLNKLNKCNEIGVELLQFTDYDILNKTNILFSMIKAKLGLNTKIIANDCKIQVIDNETANKFHNNNSLYSYKPTEIHKGLIYNNELVTLISLDKSSDNYCEVINHVNLIDYDIIDSFSMLIKNLEYNGKLIFNDDRNYSNTVCESCNWKLESITNPNCYYTNDYENLYHQDVFQYHKLKTHDNNLTELENIKLNGYDRFWDCGNKVYSFIN